MTHQELTILAERMTGMFHSTDCYSVSRSGKATEDCDIAIDTVDESRVPYEILPESVMQYWVDTVPYDESLTRHKFIISNI